MTRPVSKLKEDIKHQVETGKLNIGVKIAPKIVKTNIINDDGKMVDKTYSVYGRKIPLKQILEEMTEEQIGMGIIRWNKDSIDNIGMTEVTNFFSQIDEPVPDDLETARIKISELGQRRHLKVWHDHSDILNRTYFSIMISCIYDRAFYLTNQEYKAKYPDRKPVHVQSLVEKPKMYVFGQSKSTDIDQMSYTPTRIQDLQTLDLPTVGSTGIKIYDVMRIFTGDNPARQFECGQQRGGNYSCLCGIHVKDHSNLAAALHQKTLSLQERLDIFKEGTMWKHFSASNINPLSNLKKNDLIDELDSRDIDVYNLNKTDLQSKLSEILHGIQRPAALICPSLFNDDTLSTLNCQHYEISNCEPLHDITNVVQNLLTELPHHMPSSSLQKEYQTFCELLIGDKNQIKGSDARLYAIKLAQFSQSKYEEGVLNYDIPALCTALTEIIRICYSTEDERSPKQVLRLYNQCFQFGLLVTHVIEKPVKLSARKFFGIHFHSLVIHFPEIYHLFCLRSLIPEDEERTFGDLRSISEKTSNRQAPLVVDNCMLRYLAKEKRNDRSENFKKLNYLIYIIKMCKCML
jgi:hypothetical protein